MQRDRLYLKSRFVTGSRPTQADFHDLIDSFFNHLDDAFENFGLTLYNSERTYNTNDTCIYNGCIYICNDRNVSGPFNPDKWDYITDVPAIYSLNQWQSNVTYNQYDIVRYKGKVYYSKQNNNIGNIPTNTTWWQEVNCTKQNMVNWQPGVYFKDQKIIYNNNVYQVNCQTYTLSINASSDIATGKLLPILQKRIIADIWLIKENNVIDVSNNYVIEIGDIENFKNGDKVVVKRSNNQYFEVTIYNLYQGLKWRIKEVLLEGSYGVMYYTPTSHAIIDVDKDNKKFTISGIVGFETGFLQVKGSSYNDGFYTIVSITYQSGNTIITVNETINSNEVNGNILRYTEMSTIYSTFKLPGCILKTNNEYQIQYRTGKYINYKSKNYELMAVTDNGDNYELTINASSLSIQEPYGTCIFGYTNAIQHNLNTYYFNFQIYNAESKETVSLEALRLKALDLNKVEIDIKDPTKYSYADHVVILNS